MQAGGSNYRVRLAAPAFASRFHIFNLADFHGFLSSLSELLNVSPSHFVLRMTAMLAHSHASFSVFFKNNLAFRPVCCLSETPSY
jgi:hypothetical protein